MHTELGCNTINSLLYKLIYLSKIIQEKNIPEAFSFVKNNRQEVEKCEEEVLISVDVMLLTTTHLWN